MRYFLVLILALLSTAGMADECRFNGLWRSHEAKTLESMNKIGQVTEKQRKLFENGFFGQLTHEVDCGKVKTTYDGIVSVSTFKIVKENGTKIVISEVDEEGNSAEIYIHTYNDDFSCYYQPISNLNFNEYFCRER